MRLIETEERLTTLLARLPAAVYLDRYCRRDGSFIEVVYVSPQMVELTGHPVEAFLADPNLYPRLIHPDDKAKVLGLDVEGHASGEPIEQEYRIIHADGHVIWIREEARLVPAANADTILSHGFLVDITDRKALEQQLGRLAFQDPLTGLANRALFADRLAQALARSARSGVYPAVLFLDLDEFKTVNDSLGHAAGDTLLQVVGERLHGAIRPSDCVARLGGDEFAVLLEDVTADVAIATATRLIHLLRSPIEIEGRQMTGRGSIGIAVAGKDTASPNDLLRDADAAMYRAKALRRGNWVLFQPEMHVEALARFDLEADLRTAIETDSLTVAYQPIYSFATGHPGAVEALARWDHPTRGPISPLGLHRHRRGCGPHRRRRPDGPREGLPPGRRLAPRRHGRRRLRAWRQRLGEAAHGRAPGHGRGDPRGVRLAGREPRHRGDRERRHARCPRRDRGPRRTPRNGRQGRRRRLRDGVFVARLPPAAADRHHQDRPDLRRGRGEAVRGGAHPGGHPDRRCPLAADRRRGHRDRGAGRGARGARLRVRPGVPVRCAATGRDDGRSWRVSPEPRDGATDDPQGDGRGLDVGSADR